MLTLIFQTNFLKFCRLEFRGDSIPCTSVLICRVDGIDQQSGALIVSTRACICGTHSALCNLNSCMQVAGYALLNIFGLVGNTLEQPVAQSQKHVLNSGCFQLPLYIGTINRDKPLNAKSLDFATLSPCASVLVRGVL